MRSAALIIKDNKLLACKNANYDCFYTLGGGINLNEASTDAVLRELREETGYEFEIDRLVFIQERYFSLKDCRQHEVVFFYLMKNVDVNIDNGTKTNQQSEHLHWLPIDELDITQKYSGDDEMIPFHYYDIIRKTDRVTVGKISIRSGNNFHSYYNGHIGYEVFK